MAVAALSSGCAAGGGAGPGGRVRPSGLREDRVLVGSLDDITQVAVSQRMVFATTRDALATLDRQFGTWLPPLTVADGYPAGPATAIAADPVDDAVWVGTLGAVTFYRPLLDYHLSTIVPGQVQQIVFDRRDPGAGAYVLSSGTWTLISRTGNAMMADPARLPPPAFRIVTPRLEDLFREYPSLRSFQSLLTRDEQLQSWPLSAGSKQPDRSSEIWLGTRGNGLYKADPVFNKSEHFPYGLLAPGAAALAPAADGIWVAGLGGGRAQRSGLTFASEDLQRWRWLQGTLSRPLQGARTYALDVRGRIAWLATDRGAVRMDTQNDNDVRVWTLGNGLPDDRALAVAATARGAWIGTGRGVVFISDSGSGRGAARGAVSSTIVAGTPVRALLATGDTLWVGTESGLLLLAPGDTLPRRPAAAASDPRFRRPVVALARSDSEVVVALQDDIVRLALPDGRVLPRFEAVNIASLRGITAVDMDQSTIWAVGYGGVLVIARASGVSRFLAAPGEIPAEAYDVLLRGDYGWVATRAGLLRLRRVTGGSVR
ncbi:MAG: hypothetical protein WKG32_00635 [Gemmatimonadaceae bacterium]